MLILFVALIIFVLALRVCPGWESEQISVRRAWMRWSWPVLLQTAIYLRNPDTRRRWWMPDETARVAPAFSSLFAGNLRRGP